MPCLLFSFIPFPRWLRRLNAGWFSRLLEVFMRSDFFSETELARIRIQSCREPARSPLTICRPYGRAGLEFLLLEGQDGSFW